MNEIRLIDANALFERIGQIKPKNKQQYEDIGLFMNMITNAPTVFTCNACKNMGNERECVDCHDYSNYVHYEERPQGEWGKWIIAEVQCPNCFKYFEVDYYSAEELNKCPNCGARMQ